MICRSFINKTLIYFADYDNMLLFNFCSGSIVMNAMRFYFKTTSKIVLTIFFFTKKLREFDLAQPGKKHSVNSSEIYPIQTQFACKCLCKFQSLGHDRESHVLKTIEF